MIHLIHSLKSELKKKYESFLISSLNHLELNISEYRDKDRDKMFLSKTRGIRKYVICQGSKTTPNK